MLLCPARLDAPAAAAMGMVAELQQLHTAEREAQQQEVRGHPGVVRQLLGEGCRRIQGLSRGWPPPQRPPAWRQPLPVALPFPLLQLRRQAVVRSAQAELAAGTGQQPAELHRWLAGQLRWLGAAAIGKQIQLRRPRPATKHKRAHPWCAVGGHGGQLQPARHG